MGPMRAPARGSRGSVVRTYAAGDREAAERSFLDDRQAAGERGWLPVSRYWRSEGRDQVLTVVYELTWGDGLEAAAAEVEAGRGGNAKVEARWNAPTGTGRRPHRAR